MTYSIGDVLHSRHNHTKVTIISYSNYTNYKDNGFGYLDYELSKELSKTIRFNWRRRITKIIITKGVEIKY